MLADLGVELDAAGYEWVQESANRQLGDRDFAVVRCPQGVARLAVVR